MLVIKFRSRVCLLVLRAGLSWSFWPLPAEATGGFDSILKLNESALRSFSATRFSDALELGLAVMEDSGAPEGFRQRALPAKQACLQAYRSKEIGKIRAEVKAMFDTGNPGEIAPQVEACFGTMAEEAGKAPAASGKNWKPPGFHFDSSSVKVYLSRPSVLTILEKNDPENSLLMKSREIRARARAEAAARQKNTTASAPPALPASASPAAPAAAPEAGTAPAKR